MRTDPFDHPDLRDPEWNRRAERNARRAARRALVRRLRLPRTALLLGAVLIAVAAATYALHIREPEPPAPPEIDLARPFAGTPAQDWPAGADGIVLPPPHEVGSLSADEVAAALEQVRSLLVRARLDRSVVQGGDVEPVVGHFAPSYQDQVRGAFADPGRWPSYYATRVAPGFRLLPAEPRVNGTMTAEPGERRGELRVRTDYVVAYAFDIGDPAAARAPLDIVAAERWEITYLLRVGETWYPRNRGIYLESGRGHGYSIACGPMARGLLAPAYSEPAPHTLPNPGVPGEFFDLDRPLPGQGTCDLPPTG
ncbi:hypothetical protein SAMN05421810_102456 [Amycolatopsis arida]|uniref:Uncharacterized protein n=1 Tax=Amycolatopsis arida TaxID=587909 RepID=A0A1I5Q097_9PSEU|nr:hypothetical protein [Amycolatopsis arida]TDX98662.1 hypothetical protein CLV69_101456 [Amycolatopsis arida]SFP39391.1 hypothetical protein SAMN05421810_102456 [Amycolatopsis arida]